MLTTVADTDQKSRIGRPPLPPEARRSAVIAVRVTEQEADSAYRYALKHGIPLDAVLRKILARLTQ